MYEVHSSVNKFIALHKLSSEKAPAVTTWNEKDALAQDNRWPHELKRMVLNANKQRKVYTSLQLLNRCLVFTAFFLRLHENSTSSRFYR